jgi:predicted nucleotidyltransferase
MATKEGIISFIKDQRAYLAREYNVISIALFGSYARDEASTDSDIDLLIEFQDNTPNLSKTKEGIKQLFKEQFNLNVDLCRQKFIKSYYRDEILASAIYVE